MEAGDQQIAVGAARDPYEEYDLDFLKAAGCIERLAGWTEIASDLKGREHTT
jgi:hypothetical protein